MIIDDQNEKNMDNIIKKNMISSPWLAEMNIIINTIT
jgi:hypothetical protein